MAKKRVRPLFEGSEWTFDKLRKTYDAIEQIAVEELKLTYYPNQIEIISSEQMLDNYTSIGLPIMYNHWSFGKHFLREEYHYRKGHMGLAYEIVINCSPCISYLMEENSMTMQALTISHASLGHNSFFKNNYLFKQWTDAAGIIDYLVFAKKYIAKCEEQHGREAVEKILDSCHALRNYGVDRYRRPGKLNKEMEEKQQRERESLVQRQANDLWRTLPPAAKSETPVEAERFPKEPQENILYFIEKHSPVLDSWQREIVRIVRKIAQYFAPQRLTQVGNEGWACTVHYYIMNRLWEKGLITDGHYMEFIHSHTSVVFQPTYDDKRFGGFNPYYLGFNLFQDIRRICEKPTTEDIEWFPDIAGKPWLPVFHDVVANYRDESFIRQFLSPHFIREARIFSVNDHQDADDLVIDRIHNERGYRDIRNALARQYETRDPDIQVVDANLRGNRTLRLQHTRYDGVDLHTSAPDVLGHLSRLWGYDVVLDSVDYQTQQVVKSFSFQI